MEAWTELHKFLLHEALDRYEEEYKELLDTWRDLERKAQVIATVAGAFLAGVFVILRQPTLSVSSDIKVLLFLAVALLALVFFCSLLVLSLRERRVAPSSKITYHFVCDLLLSKDVAALDEEIPRFLNDRIMQWKGVNENIHNLNRDKAKRLWWAQIFLIAAMFVISALTVFFIFRIPNP